MRLRNKVLSGVAIVVAVAVLALAFSLSRDAPCGATPPPTDKAPTMAAMTRRCYGTADVLKLETLARPTPAADELLVRVHAASVNPLDWHYLHGMPYLVRLDSGMGRPDNPRLGVDFSGTVEAVGKGVTRYKPGDEVFGGKFGAFGEYVAVRESRAVTLKPANVSFEEAAAVPVAALTALQALRNKGHLQAGQKVLVNGASGGVGTYAVQIAKALGAEVTGVCSTRNVELVRSLGADHVIDYTREDFTRGTQQYDLIVDTVGSHPLLEHRRVLTPHGVFVIVGGPSNGNWIGPMNTALWAVVVSPFVGQSFKPFLAELNKEDLGLVADLMRDGKVKSVIDRTYKLAETPAALRYLEAGHARGKVIIEVD